MPGNVSMYANTIMTIKTGWNVMTAHWTLQDWVKRCMDRNMILWLHWLVATAQTLASNDVHSARWQRPYPGLVHAFSIFLMQSMLLICWLYMQYFADMFALWFPETGRFQRSSWMLCVLSHFGDKCLNPPKFLTNYLRAFLLPPVLGKV